MEGITIDKEAVLVVMDPKVFAIREIILPNIGSLEQPIQISHAPRTMSIDETPMHDQVKAL